MAMTMQARRFLLIAFIASISTCALMGIYVLLRGQMGTVEGKVLWTTALVCGASILALASAFLWERRRWHPIGMLGLLASVMALATALLLVWYRFPPGFRWWERTWGSLTFTVWVSAIALPCIGMLSFANIHRRFGWVRQGTVIALSSLAGMLMYAFLWQPHHSVLQVLNRYIGVSAILSVCGALALAVLHMVSRIESRESQRTTDLQVEIICPRCTTRQTLPVGRSACANCRLKFALEIEEEQCPRCGYPSYLLTSSACPECGTKLKAAGGSPAST